MAAGPEVSTVDQITPDWLERVLAGAGFESARVTGFATRPVGTGQAAGVFRILPEYADVDPSLPCSIVAKFPSPDEGSRAAGAASGTYQREIEFYRQLQPQLTIRTPRCYLAERDESGRDFALLLEDMAPAEQGDQIAGCDAAMARLAVLELVGLHGPSWGNAAILDQDFVSYTVVPGRSQAVMDLVRPGLPRFMERCAGGLEADERALVERLGTQEHMPSEYPIVATKCLSHNDYRLDNFLFVPGDEAETFRAVDWQTYGAGNPMRDVSYFLGGCLLPDERRQVERDIVGEYHAALCVAGAEGYSFDECWSDYGKAAYHGLMNCLAAMLFVKQTERGDRLFTTMAQRHARQILELGADEFLD